MEQLYLGYKQETGNQQIYIGHEKSVYEAVWVNWSNINKVKVEYCDFKLITHIQTKNDDILFYLYVPYFNPDITPTVDINYKNLIWDSNHGTKFRFSSNAGYAI